MIVPITADGHVVMLRQYRYLIDRWCWEVPAGGVHPGESAEQAAIRELAEEAGYVVGAVAALGGYAPSKSVSNERLDLFLATGCTPAPERLAHDRPNSCASARCRSPTRLRWSTAARSSMVRRRWRCCSRQGASRRKCGWRLTRLPLASAFALLCPTRLQTPAPADDIRAEEQEFGSGMPPQAQGRARSMRWC